MCKNLGLYGMLTEIKRPIDMKLYFHISCIQYHEVKIVSSSGSSSSSSSSSSSI